MQDLSTKVTTNTLSASEWNEIPTEVQKVITNSGIALSGGDLNQLAKSLALSEAKSTYLVATGSTNAWTLTPSGSLQGPIAYETGMVYSFRPTTGNTTAAVTVNISGLGAKNVLTTGTVALAIGDISTTQDAYIRYDGTQFQLLNPQADQFITPHQTGGQFVRDGADGFKFTINPGSWSDSTGTQVIQLASAITKDYSVNWVAGSSFAGAFSGAALSNGTWRPIFVIKHLDGTVDVGIDSPANYKTATALLSASSYTHFRRIGWIYHETGTGHNSDLVNSAEDPAEWVWTWAQTVANVAGSGSYTGETDVSVANESPPNVLAKLITGFSGTSGTHYLAVRGKHDATGIPPVGGWDIWTAHNGSSDMAINHNSKWTFDQVPSKLVVRTTSSGANFYIGIKGFRDEGWV